MSRSKRVEVGKLKGSKASAQKKKKPRSKSKEGKRKEAAAQEVPVEEKSNWKVNLVRVLALIFVIGITVFIYSIRERVQEFEKFGYPGIFLIVLLSNATVFIPAPGVAVVFAMGSIFNPSGVALAAGTGGALGELTGYLAGFSGQAIIENAHIYNRIKPWVDKFGGWTILVMSAIPNPFFDLAGIAAGIVKMPMWRFLLFTWFGQLIKMAMFAYAGRYSLNWLGTMIG